MVYEPQTIYLTPQNTYKKKRAMLLKKRFPESILYSILFIVNFVLWRKVLCECRVKFFHQTFFILKYLLNIPYKET